MILDLVLTAKLSVQSNIIAMVENVWPNQPRCMEVWPFITRFTVTVSLGGTLLRIRGLCLPTRIYTTCCSLTSFPIIMAKLVSSNKHSATIQLGVTMLCEVTP